MELQLGLTLSLHSTPSKGFDFDLNKRWSCLDAQSLSSGKRRRFDATAGNDADEGAVAPELRLVSWNRQPNEEEDHHDDERNRERDCPTMYRDGRDEDNEVVGWPPIKSWRKKKHHLHHHHYHHHHCHCHHSGWIMVRNNSNVDRAASIERGGSSSSIITSPSSKSIFVKVKMEGVAIARKVDVKLFNSFESLTHSLVAMFSHYEGYEGDDTRYTLAYQAKDGDWLPAGYVPWKNFIEVVGRIKISRNNYFVYKKCTRHPK